MTKELIEVLKNIKENKFEFDDKLDKTALAYELLDDIGNHDSYLRDALVYPTLANILYYDHLSKEDLVKITEILLGDKGMKHDMQNYDELSVLTRSFSVDDSFSIFPSGPGISTTTGQGL